MQNIPIDIVKLLLRLSFGFLMIFGHGWKKLINYQAMHQSFPDPIGLGSNISLILAIFAEVACAALLIIGWKTRLASIPLIIMMLVAIFIIHAADPFGRKEMAILYLTGFIAIFLAGPGKYSLDKK